MRDLDTASLRRQASDSARRNQRHLRVTLFTVHVFLYLAALAVAAVMVLGVPYLFDVFYTSMDASLIVFGLLAGWGIGLTLHGMALVVESDWMNRRLRQQAAAGVIGRALLEDDEPDAMPKSKRWPDSETGVTLGDDGEWPGAEGEAEPMHQESRNKP